MAITTEQQPVFDKITTKPLWMKNAVLGERGWYNPETNELLLGRRTPDWVLEELALRASAAITPVEEPVTEQVTVQAETETVADTTEAPAKKSRKKKADAVVEDTTTVDEQPVTETTTQEV